MHGLFESARGRLPRQLQPISKGGRQFRAPRFFIGAIRARGNPKDFPLSSAVYVIVIFSMCGREIFNKAPSPEMESPRSSEFIRISDTRRDERRGAARRS